MGFRGVTSLRLAAAVGVAAAIVVPNALASSSPAPSGDQTYPHVTPRAGGRHRTFKLSFTLAQAPGRSGYEYTDYRAVVSAPAHTRASCSPAQPAPVTSGSRGEVETIALHQPARGWCKGRYAVTVYLQRTQTCPPPVEPGPSPNIICPLTPSHVQPAPPVEDVNTGQAHFTVR
jgi:hypothetical protein